MLLMMPDQSRVGQLNQRGGITSYIVSGTAAGDLALLYALRCSLYSTCNTRVVWSLYVYIPRVYKCIHVRVLEALLRYLQAYVTLPCTVV